MRPPGPYYSDAAVTLYHGDCLAILPTLERCDLLLTDPPYGLGKWNASGGQSLSQSEADDVNLWDQAAQASRDDALAVAIRMCRYAVVWGGNYLADILGKTRAPLIWDKAIRGMHFADGEMAWTNFDFGTLRILNLPIASGETKGQRLHPTQKPEGVMRWSIQQVKAAELILDPFAGSGTTAVAAKRLGRRAILIERDEKYCEIAAARLSQAVLDLAAPAPVARQSGMAWGDEA